MNGLNVDVRGVDTFDYKFHYRIMADTDTETQLLKQYHVEAKQTLVAGERPNNLPTRFKSLAAMSHKTKLSPEFMETYVMLAVAGRVRPARAHGQMSMLKKARAAAGQSEMFHEFEALLTINLSGGHFSAHGYLARNLGTVDPQDLYSGMLGVVEKINALGYQVFANSGTLLGLIRDKAPIAHDDDIDLAVVLKSTTDTAAAKEFWALRMKLEAEGYVSTDAKSSTGIIKLPSVAGFQVDLFPAYGARKRYKIYPYAYGEISKFDVLPLKTCEHSGLPIPARPEKLLQINYGAGWTTPDSRFVFPWRRSKRRFAKFLNGPKEDVTKTILTYGTFDLFHVGHVRLLRRLAELGDRVVVGCSTDEFNAIKGKRCVMPYSERVEILEACRFVDEVFPENDWDQKPDDVKRFKVDTFAMGDDWAGKFDALKEHCEVIYLDRTEGISTTDLKFSAGDYL